MFQKKYLHYFILFFGVLCIAWSAIFVKLADVSGLSSAFYRMFIGFVGIIPIWIYRRKPIADFKSIKIAALCGVFFALDIALWNTSIMLTKAAVATLIANLAPIWVGVGAIFLLKEKPKWIFWIGTAVSLVGVTIIVGFSKIFTSSINIGYVFALFASMFYGAYILTTQKGRSSIDTITFTAISMLSSVVVLGIICAITATPLTGFSYSSWMSLVGLGLISQLGGWLAINYALGYIQPTIASVSLLSQSVFTAMLSVPILGEYLSWFEMIGVVVVLYGIYLVNKRNFRSKNTIET